MPKEILDMASMAKKPTHACDLEDGEYLGPGCCHKTAVYPEDYIPKIDDTTNVDEGLCALTDVIT